MDKEKKQHIRRLFAFYLCEPVIDPDKMLATIALEANATDSEVWEVYSEVVKVSLGVH